MTNKPPRGKDHDVIDLTGPDAVRILSAEPRHGGARTKRPFQWSIDARDIADGTIPLHPETRVFKVRGFAARAMRQKYQADWPALEMKIFCCFGGFVVMNEHYETKGKQPTMWHAIGRKQRKIQYWDKPATAKGAGTEPPGEHDQAEAQNSVTIT